MKIPSVVIIGSNSQAGTYILRIRLKQDITLRFGRFKKGKLISLPASNYIYIGSALSERGSTSLARRLIRHTTRSADKPPHVTREKLMDQCVKHGLGPRDLLPKNSKTLHWNVDFLLDLQSTEIINIFAIRSPTRLENKIAERLEHDPHTEIIEPGLGANDAPGNTHLLRVRADSEWWMSLPDSVMTLLEEDALNRTSNIEG